MSRCSIKQRVAAELCDHFNYYNFSYTETSSDAALNSYFKKSTLSKELKQFELMKSGLSDIKEW